MKPIIVYDFGAVTMSPLLPIMRETLCCIIYCYLSYAIPAKTLKTTMRAGSTVANLNNKPRDQKWSILSGV